MGLDYFLGRRVLLTGDTGFKGAWTAEWLLSLGAEVTGLADEIPTEPSLFRVLGLPARMRHLRCDIRDQSQVDAVFSAVRPEVVLHLAAQALVRKSYDEPVTTFATNILGTVHVLEAIRKTPEVRAAVIVASDKCYENPNYDHRFSETDRLGGADPYSASKGAAEVVFNSYVQSFFSKKSSLARIASVRAGNVIGGGDWAQDRIIPDCVRSWSKGETVTIRNPDATRPWQHVLEPVGAYLLLAARLSINPKNVVGQNFNVGPRSDSVGLSVRSLLESFIARWPGARWQHEADRSAKTEAKTLQLNSEKFMSELCWQPQLTFAETVALTVDWYRAYYEAPERAPSLLREQIQAYQARLENSRAGAELGV